MRVGIKIALCTLARAIFALNMQILSFNRNTRYLHIKWSHWYLYAISNNTMKKTNNNLTGNRTTITWIHNYMLVIFILVIYIRSCSIIYLHQTGQVNIYFLCGDCSGIAIYIIGGNVIYSLPITNLWQTNLLLLSE